MRVFSVYDRWGFPTLIPWPVREGDSCFSYDEKENVLVKIYNTVNCLRIFLSSSCHPVIWSFGYSVTWVTQSLCHLVTRSLKSFSHSVIQSLGHSVMRSLNHSVTWSLCHLVSWSLSHSVTWSFGHSVTSHYSFIFNVVTD